MYFIFLAQTEGDAYAPDLIQLVQTGAVILKLE